jgi:hypothetical protein
VDRYKIRGIDNNPDGSWIENEGSYYICDYFLYDSIERLLNRANGFHIDGVHYRIFFHFLLIGDDEKFDMWNEGVKNEKYTQMLKNINDFRGFKFTSKINGNNLSLNDTHVSYSDDFGNMICRIEHEMKPLDILYFIHYIKAIEDGHHIVGNDFYKRRSDYVFHELSIMNMIEQSKLNKRLTELSMDCGFESALIEGVISDSNNSDILKKVRDIGRNFYESSSLIKKYGKNLSDFLLDYSSEVLGDDYISGLKFISKRDSCREYRMITSNWKAKRFLADVNYILGVSGALPLSHVDTKVKPRSSLIARRHLIPDCDVVQRQVRLSFEKEDFTKKFESHFNIDTPQLSKKQKKCKDIKDELERSINKGLSTLEVNPNQKDRTINRVNNFIKRYKKDHFKQISNEDLLNSKSNLKTYKSVLLSKGDEILDESIKSKFSSFKKFIHKKEEREIMKRDPEIRKDLERKKELMNSLKILKEKKSTTWRGKHYEIRGSSERKQNGVKEFELKIDNYYDILSKSSLTEDDEIEINNDELVKQSLSAVKLAKISINANSDNILREVLSFYGHGHVSSIRIDQMKLAIQERNNEPLFYVDSQFIGDSILKELCTPSHEKHLIGNLCKRPKGIEKVKNLRVKRKLMGKVKYKEYLKEKNVNLQKRNIGEKRKWQNDCTVMKDHKPNKKSKTSVSNVKESDKARLKTLLFKWRRDKSLSHHKLVLKKIEEERMLKKAEEDRIAEVKRIEAEKKKMEMDLYLEEKRQREMRIKEAALKNKLKPTEMEVKKSRIARSKIYKAFNKREHVACDLSDSRLERYRVAGTIWHTTPPSEEEAKDIGAKNNLEITNPCNLEFPVVDGEPKYPFYCDGLVYLESGLCVNADEVFFGKVLKPSKHAENIVYCLDLYSC